MSTTHVRTFESSLAAIDVSLVRTEASSFAATVDRLVDDPAIGVPLDGFDGVSLADTSVETALTPRRLQDARTGVTPAAGAIADYGTLVLESDAAGTEPVSLYPPTHVAVVRESDVLPDVASAVDSLGPRFDAGGSAVFATGVSATGDMGSLVEGVHGPKDVHVVLLTDR